MGYVTKPYRVIYEAKNYTTGLLNVQAFIFKPNLTTAGPFPMTEMPSVFAGRYYFDFITSAGDPEGEYVALIYSPTEGIQTTHRISLYANVVTQTSFDTAVAAINSNLSKVSDQVDFVTAIVL